MELVVGPACGSVAQIEAVEPVTTRRVSFFETAERPPGFQPGEYVSVL